jgi:hypothetical protein
MFSHNFASVSLATLLSVLSWPAHAQPVCTLTVVKVADLRFGSWVVVAGGTLTVSPSTNLRSGTANVVTPSQINSSVGAAQFTVRGSGNKKLTTYALTLTTPINVTSNAATMTLSAFAPSPSISAARNTPCNQISETINVGATLQVGTFLAPGSYSSANTIVLLAQ